MIDSGASSSFMDYTFALKHSIPIQTLEQLLSVETIDGHPLKSGTVTRATEMLRMEIPRHVEKLSFYLAALPRFPVVLDTRDGTRTIESASLSPESPEESQSDLVILHFNDVYEVESRKEEPVGGAARFATAIKKFSLLNPLIIFSGDCLNPSALSAITKGKHMVPILNALGVHFAVFGNHEFDFGVDTLEEYIRHMHFPWFLSNVQDKFTSEPLGHGTIKDIVTWNSIKIGFMGLVEEDWLDTLATINKSNLNYVDYVQIANQLSVELKAEGAEFIIAMTHMKWINDTRLAQSTEGIDLVLGGHDHDYGIKQVNGTWIVKSGSDFRHFTKINVRKGEAFQYTFEKTDILQHFEEDPIVQSLVNDCTQNLQNLLMEILCPIDVDLDGRVTTVRRMESNLGNLVANAMLEATHADVALLNSGTLRSNRIHPAGDFTMHDLLNILPFMDALLVVRVTGKQLLEALENGVYRYPALDGRFPQVAGMEFGFDPNAEPGHRILRDSVKIQGQYLKKNHVYQLAIKEYLANGKDGYVMFQNCSRVFDTETAQTLSTAVINHFDSIKIVRGIKQCFSGHRMSLITKSTTTSLIAFETQTDEKEVIIAVPGIEGRICHISQDMKEHLQQLRIAREEGFHGFPPLPSNDCENLDLE
ncbi:trifunctional nucleotide phosphoesterase protein YfkN-like [Rhineura floridana]|uniref:trifunctional nucleotide phosphoesterase protein YfkN-like n=1 Tax=Rhineura floridana TaxID=261503 RepID=UPI002AC82641|nr:trifunctional nucleotide phosphoesterase protein YfkN-like [Rhineura floridana]